MAKMLFMVFLALAGYILLLAEMDLEGSGENPPVFVDRSIAVDSRKNAFEVLEDGRDSKQLTASTSDSGEIEDIENSGKTMDFAGPHGLNISLAMKNISSLSNALTKKSLEPLEIEKQRDEVADDEETEENEEAEESKVESEADYKTEAANDDMTSTGTEFTTMSSEVTTVEIHDKDSNTTELVNSINDTKEVEIARFSDEKRNNSEASSILETIELEHCVPKKVCSLDKDCGSGRCTGFAVGKCDCSACMSLARCQNDSDCGGLYESCDTKTNICNCEKGLRIHGLSLFDALFKFCNILVCNGKADACLGLPCRTGTCIC